jgi:hypothetical protein
VLAQRQQRTGDDLHLSDASSCNSAMKHACSCWYVHDGNTERASTPEEDGPSAVSRPLTGKNEPNGPGLEHNVLAYKAGTQCSIDGTSLSKPRHHG